MMLSTILMKNKNVKVEAQKRVKGKGTKTFDITKNIFLSK